MDAIQPQIAGDIRRLEALVKRYLDIERSEKAACASNFMENDKETPLRSTQKGRKMTTRISIITAVYNRASTLASSIESV